MTDELCELIEHAIDSAFMDDKYPFKCYNYLTQVRATRGLVQEFINSSTAATLALTISDLDAYLEGGTDSDHLQLQEAYGHLGKPRAKKIRDYLHGILRDAWQYERNRPSTKSSL